jgi:hypothetical protein
MLPSLVDNVETSLGSLCKPVWPRGPRRLHQAGPDGTALQHLTSQAGFLHATIAAWKQHIIL